MGLSDSFINSIGNTLTGGLFGLVNSGLSIAGNAIANSQNKKLFELQWKRQKEQHDADLMFARQMWEDNNSYNAPIAQMARLRAAGLNPNLVYGSGSVVGNSSSPSNTSISNPSVSAPSMNSLAQGVNFGDAVMIGNSNALNRAQVRNLEAQAKGQEIENAANETTLSRSKQLDLELKEVAAEMAEINRAYLPTEKEVALKNAYISIDKMNAELDKIYSDVNLNRTQIDFLKSNISLNEARTDLLNSQVDLTNTQINALETRIKLEKELQPYKISLFQAQVKNYIASANLSDAKARELNQKVDELVPLLKRGYELSNDISEQKLKILRVNARDASMLSTLDVMLKEEKLTNTELKNEYQNIMNELGEQNVFFNQIDRSINTTNNLMHTMFPWMP